MKNPPRMEECEGNRTCREGVEGDTKIIIFEEK
jgi:hypothetical protein